MRSTSEDPYRKPRQTHCVLEVPCTIRLYTLLEIYGHKHHRSLECIRPLKIQDPKPVHAKLIEHRASSYYRFDLLSYGNRWWALHSQARAALQSPCLRVVSRRRAVLDGRRGPSAKSRLDKCKNNRSKKSCAGQLAMRYCEKILDPVSLTTRML